MASSATFLEEALSTDVDESAVSAIVGSLENQLGTPASIVSCQQVSSTTANQNLIHSGISNGSSTSIKNHGTTNGQPDTMNVILNSEPNKGITSSSHQLSNITQTISNSAVQGVVSSSGFVNQIQPGIGIVQTTTSFVKTQDGLKTVYATSQPNNSALPSPRLTYSTQSVGSLPNGNLNVTSVPTSNILNVTNTIQGMVSQTFAQPGNSYHKISPITEQNKVATAVNPVMIKTSASNNIQTTASSPMTTAVSIAGTPVNAVTLVKPTTANTAQGIVGNAANLSNVSLVTLRSTAPTPPGAKTNLGQRLVLPQAIVGGRPGQPGVSNFHDSVSFWNSCFNYCVCSLSLSLLIIFPSK